MTSLYASHGFTTLNKSKLYGVGGGLLGEALNVIICLLDVWQIGYNQFIFTSDVVLTGIIHVAQSIPDTVW